LPARAPTVSSSNARCASARRATTRSPVPHRTP
jgi:hypothetical protein